MTGISTFGAIYLFQSDSKNTSKKIKQNRQITNQIQSSSETVEWMNVLVQKLWPNISKFGETIVRQTIQPIVQEMDPEIVFKNFEFLKIDFGEQPIKITSMGALSRENDVLLFNSVNFESDLNFNMKTKVMGKNFEFGIRDITFDGSCELKLTPLIDSPPFFASVQFQLVELPRIDFDLTGLGNLVELPGIETVMRETVDGLVKNMFVRPNRLIVPMISPDVMTNFGMEAISNMTFVQALQ